MAALVNCTRLYCRPSARASTLPPRRTGHPPLLRSRLLPRLLVVHRYRPLRARIRQQPTNKMTANSLEADGSSPCARLEQVSKLFGSFAALRQVSVDLEPGRCYVLIGENGAGKSTLLRILAGLLRPSFGTVKIFGNNEAHDVRERIGYMSHAPMLYDELTAKENLEYFAKLYAGRKCLSPAEVLMQVGLDPELMRTLGQYSQGMRQRTSLARVLLPVPELLLLDEPFSNMDVESVQQMVALLAGFRQSNRTIVITTHQRELAAPIADWVLALKAGRVASFEPGRPTL
jgi:heme ABC exporter ATP-binding subunit CcmA